MENRFPDPLQNPQIQNGLTLEVDAAPTVNYAMQQNDVPVIRRLRIINASPTDVTDLTLEITTEPSFAYAWRRSIDRVAGNSTYDAGMVDLALAPDFLARQTEAVRGYLHLRLRQQDKILAERRLPIDVLAYDHWNGTRAIPEILAAFVMPNHPIIEQILRKAANLLKAWTGDPSFQGYQSYNRERVLLQVSAIYQAIRQAGIGYSGVPASFEQSGQKIRTPDRILKARLGNCLDLSTLFAACFEQIGLHPLIAIISGHAFPGVWLTETTFPDVTVEDALALRKRTDLGEICVLEATLATEGNAADFATAQAQARRHLDDPEKFVCAVDIQRARIGRIRPLPIRLEEQSGTPETPDTAQALGATKVPQVTKALEATKAQEATIAQETAKTIEAEAVQMKEKEEKEALDNETPAPKTPTAAGSGELQPTAPASKNQSAPNDRLERWKRKLLDLSLRNRLLNFRETRTTVPLMFPDLAALENALAKGEQLEVHPFPQDWQHSERNRELYRGRTGDDAEKALLLSELKQRRLRSVLDARELNRRLVEIYRSARSSLEENGANTLYLALGHLAWYEPNSRSGEKYLAPLLLIPIELQRRSVQSAFTLHRRDEEAMVNITLLEMLRESFGIDIQGLDPLPEDDAGIDVAAIFRRIRESVKEMPRWDVEETATIGLFSFTKFLMWRDLVERTEELKKNKLVASLIDFPHQPFPASGRLPDPERLDDDYSPEETYCPLSADSSQLAAVYAASEGKTFVLHGPPGTGKSQTIANIIAQMLAQGKTVLFVAEKMAALNVVQQRLARIGLGEFCLEVHSNKSRKTDVLRQLEETLNMAQVKPPENWAEEAKRLAQSRQELNAYVRALHQKRETGDSFYTGVSRLIAHREAPSVKLDPGLIRSATNQTLSALREKVKTLKTAGESVGHPKGHPWHGVFASSWTPEWRDQVQQAIEDALEAINGFEALVQPVATLAGLPGQDWNRTELRCLAELAEAILSRTTYASALVAIKDWNAVEEAINRWIQQGTERDQLRQELYSRYTPDILRLDLENLFSELASAERKWALPRRLTERRVIKTLRRTSKPGHKITPAQASQDIALAIRLRDKERALEAAGDEARALLGRFWQEGEADWAEIAAVRDWASAIRRIAARLAGTDTQVLHALRERWASLFSDHAEMFQTGGAYAIQLQRFAEAMEKLNAATEHLAALLSVDQALAWGTDDQRGFIPRLHQVVTQWRHHLADLRLWCIWQKERSEAISLGLAPLIELYEGGLPHEQLEPAFERSFYEGWVDMVLGQEEILRHFSRHDWEHRIEQFRLLDDRFRQLTIQMIRARLFARIPQSDAAPNQHSEMGILRREIRKQRRHMAIRSLFGRIPNLLLRLKPCLLMSPISVAQYLDTSFPPFDLVIFDEASQVPTWDAVGAIARGKEAIIVGDPKQLPPTNFFDRNTGEAEDDTVIEDLESILDDCLALNIPELHLRWHYRSRNETLIAFSNAQYYNNKLLTFPAPETHSAVKLRYVAGQYDRGKSRTNRIEAEAIVNEVIRRLRSPDTANQSIGIVTFNLPQQRLIEDLLDEARRKHPEIEPFFDQNLPEPVLVKNLENIQGDERDVILFSIGYGPDSQGRVSMDFGPLNREGGQRRLNVAITRARQEVMVFTSLRPEQIDLSRTQAAGVRDLKLFLEFAEQGLPALNRETAIAAEQTFESPFEEDVYHALTERGYQVHTQVGSSGYRIDLAVVDPDNPGRFLLGIECDGATYHSTKNARDRDKLREAVLRDLGWQLHRIWSTDWWQDREREMERLVAAIEAARIHGAGHRAKTPTVAQPPALPEEPMPAFTEEPAIQSGTQLAAPNSVAVPANSQPSPSKAERNSSSLPIYTISTADLPAGVAELDFYATEAAPHIRDFITRIVRDEGPISHSLLCQRIAPKWGIQRVTQRFSQHVAKLARSAGVKRVSHGKQVFYWAPDADPEEYNIFRLPADESTRRSAEDLPPEEVANAVLYVLRREVSLPADDLVRETARLLGYQRTGQTVEKRMRMGIELLISRGRVREVNGVLVEVTPS